MGLFKDHSYELEPAVNLAVKTVWVQVLEFENVVVCVVGSLIPFEKFT